LEEQQLNTIWHEKAFSMLLGLTYQIVYRQGSGNSTADALSRKQHDRVLHLSALSVCQPAWYSEIVHSCSTDTEAIKLKAALALKPESLQNYSLDN
jgi:hypothetical protein